MSARGTSQAGSSGQPPTTASRVTRSSSNTKTLQSSTSLSGKANSDSPSAKKVKSTTAGEQARQVLTENKLIETGEQVTPIMLFKTFKRILEKYDKTIPDDLHLTLRAYAILLQEGTSSQQVTNKAIEVRVEEKLKVAMEKVSIR